MTNDWPYRLASGHTLRNGYRVVAVIPEGAIAYTMRRDGSPDRTMVEGSRQLAEFEAAPPPPVNRAELELPPRKPTETSVMAETFDNHVPELLTEVMGDIRAALARPSHPLADALMTRAWQHVDASFCAESGYSRGDAALVMRALVGVVMHEDMQ